jgi:hypothetical protein
MMSIVDDFERREYKKMRRSAIVVVTKILRLKQKGFGEWEKPVLSNITLECLYLITEINLKLFTIKSFNFEHLWII